MAGKLPPPLPAKFGQKVKSKKVSTVWRVGEILIASEVTPAPVAT